MPENISLIAQEVDRYSGWSLSKGNAGRSIHVMADDGNCFICPDIESALFKLKELLEARNLGAKDAIRSSSRLAPDALSGTGR